MCMYLIWWWVGFVIAELLERTKQRVVAVTTHSTYGGIAILVQTALDMRLRMDKLVHTHGMRLRMTCAHTHSLIA